MTETAHAQRYSGPERRAKKDSADMLAEIHEALLGTYTEEGLVSKVRRHEGFIKGWERLKWLAISVMVVSVFGWMTAVVTFFAKQSTATAQCTSTAEVKK